MKILLVKYEKTSLHLLITLKFCVPEIVQGQDLSS